ncbi:MAG TPA: hypothetical protein VGH40_17260 [Roseiarcus sp.]|jgi:hypothetical protein
MSSGAGPNEFFEVLSDPKSPHHHDVDYLIGHVFSAEDGSRKVPSVGITEHGPQYVGKAHVAELFQQLFTTFPDLTLTPLAGAPWLESPGGDSPRTVGVQAVLAGRHHAKWFPQGHQFYSPPLSNIHPDKVHTMKVPAFAVFTLDGEDRISQLALYLDRYRMMQQLTPSDAKNAPVDGSTVNVSAGKRITITIEG